jgi:hypothetical protein
MDDLYFCKKAAIDFIGLGLSACPLRLATRARSSTEAFVIIIWTSSSRVETPKRLLERAIRPCGDQVSDEVMAYASANLVSRANAYLRLI